MRTALDTRPVFHVAGALMSVLAVAMLAALLVEIGAGGGEWMAFAASAGITLFCGVLLMLMNRTERVALTLRQTFLLTSVSWVLVGAFATLPFRLSDQLDLSTADAVFEAMSGLTATGATVIVGLDTLSPGLLLWRSLLQWMGGIGIIAMGIAVLPVLRVGGMQLFRSESSERYEKVVPRASELVAAVMWIYSLLTLCCAACLALAGMSPFDAVNHAMTTLSTAGFSTRDASIGDWNNPVIEWILVVFMMAGGVPMARFVSALRGDLGPIWRDTQVRWYLGFMAVVSLVMAAWLYATLDLPVDDAVRLSTFNVVSVVTTTGFVSGDYGLWGPTAIMVFLILSTIGGCTGSTTGGIKIFRFEVLFMVLRVQIHRLYTPHRVLPLRYNDRSVDADVMISVMSFGFVYMTSIFLVALALGGFGLDLVTALSGAASAIGNIGPGLGPIIGPSGTFQPLPDNAKWLLSGAMLLGRLEFFTLLVLFGRAFWRG